MREVAYSRGITVYKRYKFNDFSLLRHMMCLLGGFYQENVLGRLGGQENLYGSTTKGEFKRIYRHKGQIFGQKERFHQFFF